MKKIILGIIVVFAFVAFFASSFFMNSLNEKVFSYLNADTSYYKVEDINYTKGLFNSKGEFKVTLNNIPYSFKVNIDFSNIILTSNNIKISILNENEDLSNIFSNEEILKILINTKLNKKIIVNARLNDLNTTHADTDIVVKNLNFIINGSDIFIDNMQLNADHILFGQPSQEDGMVELKNIKISEIPTSQLKFEDILNPSRNSEQNTTIESINFLNEIILKNLNIYTKTTTNPQNNYDNILEVNLANLQLLPNNFILDDIALAMDFKNISKEVYDKILQNSDTNLFSLILLANNFLQTDPQIFLNNFSFSKENKKFVSNGQTIVKDNSIKSQVHIQSQLLPSQIIGDLENFDEFFVDQNGSYVFDLIYDDSNKTDIKTIINGEQTDFMSVN
ncbi:hypothetical protein CINS5915_02590 [Campylobacter insulaenigrae]|uniref:DUF945 domain-containing protein n=1 Tax=Campylobacter insulaenigrae TaxID=260714 RepID=A0ABY3G6V5_9BACT|nr:DUF945 domain-containing protein [Campylobacter insulaenigrae]MCR6573661.1 hypothetical protein [Campylobacter insulaenigrae]MCR6575256.1 hypothetical protein [Campylobacter insulaenigrae]MCR6576686.1 hypothetical protein [Campylobacter insulaenigrae]MCR6579689.1 hypothetical protein [Campylobacter insulaenigrae]MCR6581712.1 hypothetical protein [Campylobacter insulaenigrae]